MDDLFQKSEIRREMQYGYDDKHDHEENSSFQTYYLLNYIKSRCGEKAEREETCLFVS